MHKELFYLKGQCKAIGWFDALKAISLAEKLHTGQKRKTGEDYIVHPIRVASALLALKLNDEEAIATAVLHDVIEDCGVSKCDLILKYGIPEKIANNVDMLSKEENYSNEDYYAEIKKHPVCILVKIADRCHNISTMVNVFSKEKIANYVQETEEQILPLCKYCKEAYPHLGDEIFTMKYHILSMLDFAKAIITD